MPKELSLLSRRQCITEEIEINAPCVVVWKILTDFPGYGSWNPFIRRIAGDLSVGRHLRVSSQLPCPTGTSIITPKLRHSHSQCSSSRFSVRRPPERQP
ncbi:MAG: SRPBCC family protein [Syntrophobacteraceae bacterium]